MIRAKLAQLLTLAALRQQFDATLDHARGRTTSADARTRAATLLFRAAALVQPADEPEDDEPSVIDVDPEEVGEEEGYRRALCYIVAVSGYEEADSHMVGLAAAGTLEWGGRSPHVKVGEA